MRPVKRTWQTFRKKVRPTDKKRIITTSTIFVFIEEKLKRAVRRINKVQWLNFEHENIKSMQFEGKISNQCNLKEKYQIRAIR